RRQVIENQKYEPCIFINIFPHEAIRQLHEEDMCRRDELQLGVGGNQCTAAQSRKAMNSLRRNMVRTPGFVPRLKAAGTAPGAQ
ncbi:MAG: hypothetical protein Q8O70_03300, partial [Burkholderiales bacterium]|nr:hypothetical protein [Burkholderiales bacterium]